MIIPGRSLMGLLALCTLAAAILVWMALPPLAVRAWVMATMMVAALALLDLWRGRRLPLPRVRRHLPDALAVLRPAPVELTLDNRRLPARFLLADHHPGDDPDTGLPARIRRAAGETTRVKYRYRPHSRGNAVFSAVELWRPSPWHLWQLRRMLPIHDEVPVYPDFAVAMGARMVTASRHVSGLRVRPRSGEGQEFHQLREYRPGDRLRQIDWNATARRHQLISREYREETSQPLIILLDGGQRLAMPVNHLTAFDHSLNAALALAASALDEGDRPGLMLHAADEPLWVPPLRHRGALSRLLHGLYPLKASEQASDFPLAARELLQRHRQRATVIWITRLQPDDRNELLTAMRVLSVRHRVLIGDMQLPARRALRHARVEDFDTALRVAADARFGQDQQSLHRHLRHQGVPVIAATPGEMGARLNALYLSLRRGRRI